MNTINSYMQNQKTKLIFIDGLGFTAISIKQDSYFKKWCDERRESK